MKRFAYDIKLFLRNFTVLYFLLIVIFKGLPEIECYESRWITLFVILTVDTLYYVADKDFYEEKTE